MKIIIAANTIEEARGTMITNKLKENECIFLSGEGAQITKHWFAPLRNFVEKHGNLKKGQVIGSLGYLAQQRYPKLFI